MVQHVQKHVEAEHIIDLHIQHMMDQDAQVVINQVEVLHVIHEHVVVA